MQKVIPGKAPRTSTSTADCTRLLGGEGPDAKPEPAARFHRILTLTIEGGFLDGCVFQFDTYLNTFIGGRGTGKTTALEIIRWVLDRVPKSGARAKEFEKLIRANLGGGKARLKVETADGVVYFIERNATEPPRCFNERGEAAQFSVQKGVVFAVDAYSQNEIEQIADSQQYQLGLVDNFVQGQIQTIDEQIRGVTAQLATNAGEMTDLEAGIERLREELTELPDVTEKLKGLVLPGSADAEDEMQREQHRDVLRKQEIGAYRQIAEVLAEGVVELERAGHGLAQRVSDCLHEDLLAGPNADPIGELRELLGRQLRTFDRKLADTVASLKAGQVDVTDATMELERRHRKQEERYLELTKQYEQERGRAKERAILLRKQSELQEKEKRLRAREQDLVKKGKARRQLLQRLSHLRDERYGQRKGVADMLNEKLGPTIRTSIRLFGDTTRYRAVLAEAFKRSGLRYGNVLDKIVEHIAPHDLVALVRKDDRKALEAQLEMDGDRAARLLLLLRESGLLYELEVVELSDLPVIELRDGNAYKDSSSLSTGQKCTTILPILLLWSERPLLIDQPEDNLDNAFIYETVVKSIRRAEGQRQLIFVSHNPAVPVLGESRQVFVMESTGQRGRIKACGDVDAVKGDIVTLLEGGSEAFRRRKERYGY